MAFILNKPDHAIAILGVTDTTITLSDRTLAASFYLSPETLHADWPPREAARLTAEDLAGPLALQPAVILLGTGARQQFPATEVLAACLTRGVGIEVMDNHAAARTFSILAGEGRRVVAAFLLG